MTRTPRRAGKAATCWERLRPVVLKARAERGRPVPVCIPVRAVAALIALACAAAAAAVLCARRAARYAAASSTAWPPSLSCVRPRLARPRDRLLPHPDTLALAASLNAVLDAERAAHSEAFRARRAFQSDFAALSHDIRTPLAGAQGYLELYGMAGRDGDGTVAGDAAAAGHGGVPHGAGRLRAGRPRQTRWLPGFGPGAPGDRARARRRPVRLRPRRRPRPQARPGVRSRSTPWCSTPWWRSTPPLPSGDGSPASRSRTRGPSLWLTARRSGASWRTWWRTRSTTGRVRRPSSSGSNPHRARSSPVVPPPASAVRAGPELASALRVGLGPTSSEPASPAAGCAS